MGTQRDSSQGERNGDLQISQDIQFERRDWRFQRIGWTAMLLMALAALGGLLGPAPWTRMTAGTPGTALWVEYYRFDRIEAPTDLKINIGPSTSPGEGNGPREVRVWIDRSYTEAADIEHISPEPNRCEAGPDRLVYVYTLTDVSRPTAVRISFRAQQFGSRQGRVGLEQGPEVAFTQFFYP